MKKLLILGVTSLTMATVLAVVAETTVHHEIPGNAQLSEKTMRNYCESLGGGWEYNSSGCIKRTLQ